MPYNNLNLRPRNTAEARDMMSTVPSVPVSQYDSMLASAVSPSKPDNYGPLKYFTDTYNRWNYNASESEKKSNEGDLAMNIEPEIASINNRLNTIKEIDGITNTIGQIDSLLGTVTNPNKQAELLMQRDSLKNKASELEVQLLKYQQDRLSKAAEELEKVKLRLKDKPSIEVMRTDEYKRFNELYQEVSKLSQGDTIGVVDDLAKRLNELQALKESKTNKINELNAEMEKYGNNITRYFGAMEQSNDGAIDFSDINTYLYKLPGLHGSSSAQWKEQLATTAATMLLTGGSKLAASAAEKGAKALGAGLGLSKAIGSTVGAAAKGGGALAAITGNLYTRDRESMMEVFTNYETSVKNKLESKGLTLDPYVAKAKENKKYAGLSDENIVSKILTGEIKVDDSNINKILEDSKLGLSQLYKDNMMLSISDVAQDYLMIMPWAKVLGKVGSVTTSAGNAVKDKLSKAIMFGLEKTPQTLNKRAARKAMGSFVSRTGTSAFLEGTEEGIQYIKGQDYVDEVHRDQEANYYRALLNDVSAAGKSTFGILGAAASYFGIPVKSELANDKEFIKNWKGGALLGGIMSGVVTGGSSIYEYNKAAAGNNIVMQLTADQLKAKDNMVKAQLYTTKAVTKNQNSVLDALEALKDVMPEGMTEQDIDEEIVRAKNVMTTANSQGMNNLAKALDITKDNPDYGTLIGLNLNASERLAGLKEGKKASEVEYFSATNSPEILEQFKLAYGDNFNEAIYASKIKTQLDSVTEMIDQLNVDLSNIDALYKEYGIKIDKTKAKSYLSTLNKAKDQLEKEFNDNKDVLGESGVIAYSQAEDNIKKAYAKNLLLTIAEDELMEDFLLTSGFAKDNDGKYAPISNLDEDSKSKAYKRLKDDINKYKQVAEENDIIAAEIAINDISDVANSIEEEDKEITPAEEAFVEAPKSKTVEEPIAIVEQENEPVIEPQQDAIPQTIYEALSSLENTLENTLSAVKEQLGMPPSFDTRPTGKEPVTPTETTVQGVATKDGVNFAVDGKTINIKDTQSFNVINAFEMTVGTPIYNESIAKVKQAFLEKGYDVSIEPDYSTGEVIYKVNKAVTTPTPAKTNTVEDSDTDLWADAGIAFRTQIGAEVEAMNPIKARRYLLRTLGLTDDQVDILDTVVTLAKSGVQLAGATKADAIVLWKGAEVGTEYHEAFHRVSLLLLDPEQRAKIYKNYRKKYKTNASDTAVEELMAEEFRMFTIANERSGITESNNIFKKIWSYIKILATSRDRKLHKLFLDINFGKYSKAKVNQESLSKFKEVYGEEGAPFKLPGGVNFNNIPFYNNYVNIVSALRTLTFTANGIQTAEDLSTISFSKVKKALEQLSKSPKITYTQKKVLDEVLDKFDSHFVQAIKDSLSQMFIRPIDETENETLGQLDSGNISDDIASHIIDSMEVSRKDNIAGSVKIFLSTIPAVKFVNNEQVAVIDSNSGLPIFENGDIVVKTMFNDLHDIESIEDIYARVAKLANTSPLYAAINSRLNAPNVRSNQNLLTQIEVAIKSHVHNYIDSRVSKELDSDGNTITSFIIDDAAGNNMVKRYPIMWGVTFVDMNLDYNVNTKSFVLNTNNINEAIKDFNDMSKLLTSTLYNPASAKTTPYGDLTTIEGLTNIKSKLLSTLARVGIIMDMTSLNDMLTDPAYADKDQLQAFRHLVAYSNATLSDGTLRATMGTIFNSILTDVVKNNGKFIKTIKKGKSVKEIQGELYDLYKGERIINNLSKYYTKNNQASEDLSVIGANGNLLYPVSQNNFMSDFTNWLNNDIELVNKLNNVAYIGGKNKRGSLLLSSVNSGDKLKLNTFISFREEGTKDKGRDYFGISPIEDYLIKMTMVAKDHLILPTMADKKRYHTISGVKLLHDHVRLEPGVSGGFVIRFSENTLSRFVDYMLTEIDAVEEGIKQVEELSNYEKVSNFHTGQKNSTYFRVFTGVNVMRDGKKVFVNFNDPKNSQKFNLQQAKDIFVGTDENPVSFDTQLDYMNQLLNEAMKSELKAAADLGVITLGDRITSAKNKLLDPTRFNSIKNEYSSSANDVIKTNAEALAVYDMIADYTINSIVSIIEFEKVFSGDPAYYKWGRDRQGNILDPTIDKIKRLGALLSTGDNLRLIWPEGHPLYNKTSYTISEMNDNMVYSDQVNELKRLFVRGNFKDLLITRRGMTEEEAERIVSDPSSVKDKTYAKEYAIAQKIAEEDSSEYAYNDTTRSGSINEADAACYISPSMLRHIVESYGEWSDAMAEAFDILESTDDWRTNPDLYFKAMKASLKALKYMSFGFNFDDKNSLAIPFFNKMAIFPLMRGLATGDNKVLYDRMNNPDSPVDMVLFNSAVKVGGRQRFSFYKDTHNKEINDLSDIPVYVQEYKYLRKQLVTDPHHHDEASLGTQVAKGVLSNIVPSRQYTSYTTGKKVSGTSLIRDIFGAMNALSNKGKDRIIKKFGATFDQDTNSFVLDADTFSKLIIADAKTSNMNINVLDGISINPETGKYNIPLSALSDNQWLEERLLSIVTGETVDIHTPGGSFIQMSSFAFKASDGTIVSDATYNKGNKLKLVNDDGSMDAIISIAMFADIIPNYDRLTFAEAKQFLIDNNVIGSGSNVKANSVGYRIPTQGLASISALRFVDVLPENYGDMIVLPDAFTKLTGSDFDIDKLYVARYTYDSVKRDVKERFHTEANDKDVAKAFFGYNEWFNEVLGVDANKQPITRKGGYKGRELDSYNDYLIATKSKVRYDAATDTYDYSWTIRDIVPTPYDDSKSYNDNSDKANVNKLLSSYITILTQRDNQHELKKSIDTATGKVKAILKTIEGEATVKKNAPFKFYSPSYQLSKKVEYTSSKRGIGPFALNNVHHALTQAFGVKFKRSDATKLLDQYNMIDLDTIFDKGSSNKVLDWLSAMINAFVDIAKDPYIVKLNIGNWTYNMTNLFLRTGMGETTFYFMPQPILKEIADKVNALDGVYGIDKTKSKTALQRKEISGVMSKYQDKAISFLPEGNTREENLAYIEKHYKSNKPLDKLDIAELLSVIQTPESARNIDWYVYQLRVLSTFEGLTPYADAVAEFVAISQVDTKKFGNTLLSQLIFARKYVTFLRPEGMSKFFTNELNTLLSESFIATKFNNSINFSKQLFSSLMFRNTRRFTDIVSILNRLTGNYYGLNVETAKRLSRVVEGKVKSEAFRNMVTPEKFRNLFFGSNTVAKRLMVLKAEIMDGKYPELLGDNGKINNELLNFIVAEPVIDRVNTDPEFITVNNNIYDKTLTNNLIIFWEELLNSEHKNIRDFAEDLILYSFYTSVDNPGANALFKYVPNSWRKSSGYAKALSEIDEQFSNESYSFDADEVFLNNWHNEDVVPTIDLYEDLGEIVIEGNITRNIKELPRVNSKHKLSRYDKVYPIVFINDRKNAGREAYVKVRMDRSNNSDSILLYKLIGEVSNGKDGFNPVYQLVQKRGYKQGSNTLYEYGSNMTYISSNLVEVINDFTAEGMVKHIKKNTEAYNKYGNELFIKKLESFTPIKDLNDEINREINENAQAISYDPTQNVITTKIPIDETTGFNVEVATVKYDRDAVDNDKSTLYIFTDNTDRTSGTNPNVGGWYAAKYGSGLSYGSANNPTTAVIRGLDNAYPISTMKWFYRNHNVSVNDARWTDNDIEEFKKVIDDELSDIKDAIAREGYTKVVIPAGDGFFNSKIANISEVRTPKLYAYLKEKVAELNALANSSTSSALVEDVQTIEETFATTQSFNIEEATLHSGGAIGADSMWDAIGSAFGLKKKRHYYHGEKTPAGNIEISAEDYQEGREKSAQAAKAVWGYQYPYMKDDRLIRNWAQVKYSDAIFAVSTIVNPGENVFPNQPKDTRTALKQAVSGGTGYAVEMAIQAGKPVYVFNQRDNKWYTWDENSSEFVQTPTPTLTNNFAGIGTREISTEGKQAIHDVYANSVANKLPEQNTAEPTIDNETINVYAGTNENAGLSNFATRHFEFDGIRFVSVEQAFQYKKAEFAGDFDAAIRILSTTSPSEARRIGRSIKGLNVSAWDKQSSEILYNNMLASFKQNEEAADLLLSTGNKQITHKYRGVEQDNGRFSELLTRIRRELATQREVENNRNLNNANKSGKDVLSGEPNIVVVNGVTLDLNDIGISFKLGEQQYEALNQIAAWLKDPKDRSNFTLVGYAGTGKTTIMKVLLHYLHKNKKSGVSSYTLAAPTHKAAGVLSKNVGESAMTLAKLLSIKPSISSTTGAVTFEQKGRDSVNMGSVIIVDEFSLINNNTVDILESITRSKGSKVLYLGDDAQLFPVGQNTTSKAINQKNVYKLTDIKRQTGNNPLIRWLQYIRDNAKVNGYLMKHSTNITANNDGRMYIPGSQSQDWLNTAAKLFNSEQYKTDADFVKILAFTNRAVNVYNYLIRMSMGYESFNDVYEGETLTAYNTLTKEGEELGIYNSSDYRVLSSEVVSAKVSTAYPELFGLTNMDADLNLRELSIKNTIAINEDTKDAITIQIVTNEDKKVMSDILRTAFLNTKKKVAEYYNLANSGEMSRIDASKYAASTWRKYYTAVEEVYTMFDVTDETGQTTYKEKSMDFGYASTIHKAQGSTYTYAFVDDADISTAEFNSVQMASQLRYVGMSRPKKAAIALTNYNIDGVAGLDNSHMTLEYFENNIDRMNNESDDTAFKTCK